MASLSVFDLVGSGGDLRMLDTVGPWIGGGVGLRSFSAELTFQFDPLSAVFAVTVTVIALAVYIHKDNPANKMSYEQLKDIYARGQKVKKWSEMGITVPGCDSDKIVVVNRQNNSGTYAYFRETVLEEREYKLGSRDMHGSKDVVDLVEKTPCAIGYSGLAYATDHLQTVCVSKKTGDDCVSPSVATASDRSYPIARPLFMYTNGEPQGAIKEYLDWIKSDAGQCILKEKGYAPIRAVSCN